MAPLPVLLASAAAVACGLVAAWRPTPRLVAVAVLAFACAVGSRAAALDVATAATAMALGVAIAAATRAVAARPAFAWAAVLVAATVCAPASRGDAGQFLLSVPAILALAAATVAVAGQLAARPTYVATAIVAALAPIGPAADSSFVVADAAVRLDVAQTAAGAIVHAALACAPDATGLGVAPWSWLPAGLGVWLAVVWLRRPLPLPWVLAWLPALAGLVLAVDDAFAVAWGCTAVRVPGLALPLPLVSGGAIDPTLLGLQGARIALVMGLAWSPVPGLAPASAASAASSGATASATSGEAPSLIAPLVRRALHLTFLAATGWLALASILGPGRVGPTWFADPAVHAAAATAAAAGIAWRGACGRWTGVHALALVAAAVAAATWVGGAAAGWATAGHLTPLP
ncbi:MAG: hypothetical protein EXR79_11520 [Myxococcales bacterium]|nr:hypothetical protein [Myxococcales bacterium]